MGPHVKLAGWECAFDAVISKARSERFSWGSHDCVTFAADCVRVQTGSDLIGSLRGTYKTARGARSVLRRLGFLTVLDAVSGRVGGPLANTRYAHRGDILTDGKALGVCVGSAGAFLAPSGLTFLPLSACAQAWRV